MVSLLEVAARDNDLERCWAPGRDVLLEGRWVMRRTPDVGRELRLLWTLSGREEGRGGVCAERRRRTVELGGEALSLNSSSSSSSSSSRGAGILSGIL